MISLEAKAYRAMMRAFALLWRTSRSGTDLGEALRCRSIAHRSRLNEWKLVNYEEENVPDKVIFFTCGILSKWGFNDGDLLSWVNSTKDCDSHETLSYIVRTLLVPKLNASVEMIDVGSSHNPIRAKSIDGIEVDLYSEEKRFDYLQPDSIELTGPEVIEIAKALAEKRLSSEPRQS